MADGVVLLVQLRNGEVVAVPFESREKADWWEQGIPYEVVGRPRVVTARALSVGVEFAKRETLEEGRCRCDGGAYGAQERPFLIHPECPVHGERQAAGSEAVDDAIDDYVRENRVGLQVWADESQNEFNGVDGRTLHAFARRGLVWFEAIDPWAKKKRYRGGLTDKGRAVLHALEAEDTAREQRTAGKSVRNAIGERIERGMTVDRLDHFKRGGRVLAINPDCSPRTPVLVRWSGLDDEWCAADLLRPVAPEKGEQHASPVSDEGRGGA
ncbi:hypothetical protein [Leifsonia shinshuensis]